MSELPHHLAQLRGGDAPGRSSRTCSPSTGDDGRLESDLALAAVENHAHGLAELLAHVLGARRD